MAFEENWAESPPEQFDRLEAVSQFKQYIFEHWKRREGPCEECPNYAPKKKCFPAVGSGHPNVEILLVGSSPGPRDRSELEIENKNRVINSATLEDHPEFDGYPLMAFYNYTIEDMNDWNGFSTLRKRFIEDSRGLDNSIENCVYFTNAKKCTDIKDRDNGEAVAMCSSYLEKEIAILDPSVIISWGDQGAKGTALALGYDTDKLPSGSTDLPLGDYQPTESCIGIRRTSEGLPPFITMPHFAMLGSNAHHISGFDTEAHDHPERQLHYELADVVKSIISK